MESDIVLVEVDAGVATVTLNRPEQRNAINLQLSRELPTAMWAADADDAVRVIILTGAGDAFCAGADLSEAASGVSPDRLDEYGYSSRDGHGSTDRFLSSFAWWRMRTPVVAAINGAAIGGGLTLALGADLRFAAADATLALPFTRMGVTPEGTATWLLPRLIGPARAAELLLSGRPFTGAEAAAMGIVNEAVARGGGRGARSRVRATGGSRHRAARGRRDQAPPPPEPGMRRPGGGIPHRVPLRRLGRAAAGHDRGRHGHA